MISPALIATSICFLFADANTSAGAPWVIWVASWSEPAKLKVTLAPPLAAPNCWPIALNASVSEAAANTVSSPVVAAGAAVGAAGAAGVAPPQAVSTTMSSIRASCQPERFMRGDPFLQQNTRIVQRAIYSRIQKSGGGIQNSSGILMLRSVSSINQLSCKLL